ncbi:MAG: Proteasome subunit alpha type-4, partial [Marteilia pararefringens]
VAVVGKACVVLGIEVKPTDKFVEGSLSQKILKIEENIYCAISGLNADGRVLINKCRFEAQQKRFDDYQEPQSIKQITHYMGNVMQYYTQSGGKRPFGISGLICGLDTSNEPCLYVVEPSGMSAQYNAFSIGKSSQPVIEFLEKQYQPLASDDDALRLALQSILEVHQNPTKDTIKLITIKYDSYEEAEDSKVAELIKYYLDKKKEEDSAKIGNI